MADSSTNLDTISQSQSQKEVTANALFDAGSVATLYGRRASTSAALTWGYYGGKVLIGATVTAIANGTVALTASSTNYVEADASGVVSANTTAFTAGRTPLYTVVTGASTVTSYTDKRTSAAGFLNSITGAVSGVSNSDGTLTVSPTTGAVVASLNLGHANTWTAKQTFRAGATGAGTAGIYLQSGSLMTSPEVGAVEFLTDKAYLTIATGTARKELALWDAAGTSGRIPFETTNGRLTDSANLVWDNTNARFGVGGTPANNFHVQRGTGGACLVLAENTGSGTGDYAGFHTGIGGSQDVAYLTSTGSGFTPSGIFVASASFCYATQTGGLWIGAANAAGVIGFFTGGSAAANERMRIAAAGDVVMGRAALATNATAGFPWIPSCAGTPTGAPTAPYTNAAAIIIDTTGSKIWVRVGSTWKSVAVA